MLFRSVKICKETRWLAITIKLNPPVLPTYLILEEAIKQNESLIERYEQNSWLKRDIGVKTTREHNESAYRGPDSFFEK